MKKKKLMISHGKITHSLDKRLDCLYCIEIEIEYLQALKKAGGKTKFLQELEDN